MTTQNDISSISSAYLQHFGQPKTRDEVEYNLLETNLSDEVYEWFYQATGNADLNPDNFGCSRLFNDLLNEVCYDLNVD